MTKFSPGNTRASKLTPEQVFEIRQLYHDEGWTQAALSRRFGITVNTIGRIVRMETHQRVPMPTQDPTTIAQRLAAIQEERDREIREKLATDLAKQPETKIRQADEALNQFLDPTAKSRYGIEE